MRIGVLEVSASLSATVEIKQYVLSEGKSPKVVLKEQTYRDKLTSPPFSGLFNPKKCL